jgi:hypothetical protein
MMSESDFEYFTARGKAERELSKASTEPIVAAIHARMAECYERLASEAGPPRPSLRIIAA